MQEEDNAATNEDHLRILTALLQLQADELSNAIPTHRGTEFGTSKDKEWPRMVTHAMIYAKNSTNNTLCTRKEFQHCFRMNRELFMMLLHRV
jgi:hypothetical protein